jgi:hypothetical protein
MTYEHWHIEFVAYKLKTDSDITGSPFTDSDSLRARIRLFEINQFTQALQFGQRNNSLEPAVLGHFLLNLVTLTQLIPHKAAILVLVDNIVYSIYR